MDKSSTKTKEVLNPITGKPSKVATAHQEDSDNDNLSTKDETTLPEDSNNVFDETNSEDDKNDDVQPSETNETDETSETQDKKPSPEERYKQSSQEAIRLAKELKELKESNAQLQLAKDSEQVKANPLNIFDIAKEDPDKAETIARNVFDKTVDEVTEDVMASETLTQEQKNTVLIANEVKKEMQKMKAQTEQDQVHELESNFFASKGLTPGSAEHTQAVTHYKRLVSGQNKTMSFVKNALEMVHSSVTSQPVTDTELDKAKSEAANLSFSSTTATKTDKKLPLSKADTNFLKRLGVSPNKVMDRVKARKG